MAREEATTSLPPKMARFIRSKVKAGDYTNASEVVRDAVRHMQEAEVFKNERHALLASDPDMLTGDERESVQQSVQRGVKDFEEGRYQGV
jgi:putative addiction module CopG family antidote